MAGLPKEPRQKMINVMYLVLTAILALNVSSEVISAFKVVDRSLVVSNDNINTSNQTIYKSLEQKLAEPQSAERAKIWQPKAEQARKLSTDLISYIDDLKLQLKKEAGLRVENGQESFKEDNLDASTRLFETNGKGEELRNRLEQYKTDMLAIDPAIKKEFENNFPVNTIPPISQEGKQLSFTQSFFHMTPTIAALTMLSKFQNNIRNAENQIVTYAHNQIGSVEVHMDQVGVLVGQNSNYLMPGQELVVTAGVGAYSSSATPTISINGTNVPVSGGQGSYRTTVSGSGEKAVTVRVTFRDENNKLITKDQTVKYTVGTPGGAAVMLDKMNVFYIGVDNPVTISSGTGWDKTKVSMTGGTLQSAGGPGKFVVKVKSLGKATISVNSDGKVSSYDFRIKNIPNPVLMVGPSDGGRVQSVVFKNQQFARAALNDFDFDYRYNLVSATVYFSGANFPSTVSGTIQGGSLAPIKQYLDRCIPGTTVTFDNVKVQGPGGPVKTIPGAGFVLY